jgi:hypothetical protein
VRKAKPGSGADFDPRDQLTHLIIVGKCQNIMPGRYVMQSQVVAILPQAVVSDSLSPLDFMLTGEEARKDRLVGDGSLGG